MRVLQITGSGSAGFPPTDYGGVETYILQTALRLAKKFDIAILHGDVEGGIGRRKRIGDFHVFYTPLNDFSHILQESKLNIPITLLNKLSTAYHLYLVSRHLEYDILHLHEAIPQLFNGILDKRPKAFTFHGSHTAIPYELQTFHAKRLSWDWESFVAKRCDHIFAISNLCKKNIMAHLGIDEEKISVAHYGMDCEKFRPLKTDLKQRIFGNEGPLLMDITRLAKDKGIHLTIKAVASLRKEYPDIKCVFCGMRGEDLLKNGYGRYLLDMIRKEGLSANILFPGRISRELLPAYISAADVFVHPASAEAFGLAVAEAMACGKPPVCLGNSGGPDDMIDNNRDGFLVGGAVPEISEKISFLLDNPRTARLLGRNARKKMASQFTWEQTAEKIAKAYQTLF